MTLSDEEIVDVQLEYLVLLLLDAAAPLFDSEFGLFPANCAFTVLRTHRYYKKYQKNHKSGCYVAVMLQRRKKQCWGLR